MIVDAAIGCMLPQLALSARSLVPFDGFVVDDDIDLADDVAVGRIDDAIREYQTLRHQRKACETSVKNK